MAFAASFETLVVNQRAASTSSIASCSTASPLKEDAQILNGDGIGENLSGLVTNATGYAAPMDPVGIETMIDTVALGMLQTTLADFTPNGIVMHPSDWMRIRLLKNADGDYLLGEPGAQAAPTLFGLPVVPTTSMTVDKFLIGDFKAAATLYDRWAPRVEVSTEHADFFTRNLVAILAEEGTALPTKQPLCPHVWRLRQCRMTSGSAPFALTIRLRACGNQVKCRSHPRGR